MKNGEPSFMIHQDKEQFRHLVDWTASATGFYAPLMEKDYYLTYILSHIHELCEDLIFKGGTCLNKIYYSYYRLSEDLDFSMRLPEYTATRGTRRKSIQRVKDNIESFAKKLGFRLEGADKAGRNESKQYVYYFVYDSVMAPSEQTIKLEIGLRFNPILPPELRVVQHKFIHPFTGEVLFDAGQVNCLPLQEIVAEKLRAAATRLKIAPRDFYDLGHLIKMGFDLSDLDFLQLFQKKLAEDEFDTDLKKYRYNLGRSETEIRDMEASIEQELVAILTLEEQKKFNLSATLKSINAMLKDI